MLHWLEHHYRLDHGTIGLDLRVEEGDRQEKAFPDFHQEGSFQIFENFHQELAFHYFHRFHQEGVFHYFHHFH